MKYLNKFKNYIKKILHRKIEIYGNFHSWQEALAKSKGYDDNVIFEIKKKSFEKVISGKALYERDSHLFFKKKYNNFLVSRLNHLNKKLNRKIEVCDYGGSFGSVYFQHKDIFLKKFIEWNIIEQKKYVNYANDRININNLNFYSSLEDLFLEKKIDLVIFSSVLQYLENPYQILKFILKNKISEVIIMRTPFFSNYEEIKIQKVPKYIYESSYPIRILNLAKLKRIFNEFNYKLTYQKNIYETLDKFKYTNIHYTK